MKLKEIKFSLKNYSNMLSDPSKDNAIKDITSFILRYRKKILKYHYLYLSQLNKILYKLLKNKFHTIIPDRILKDYFYFLVLILKIGDIKTLKLSKKLLSLLEGKEKKIFFSNRKERLFYFFSILRKKIKKAKREKNIFNIYTSYPIIDIWHNNT